MPQFNDLVHIQKLNPDLVPVDLAGVDADSKKRKRLIIVGDVHGCKEECKFGKISMPETPKAQC